ncbi:hepatoma-derived growth factor-related protein 2-like [Cebidichthys violaceus]|uniref:hepatoma-derived growth factor-related protein 2-like n=1 Tax=Cebidichthys violaceus TaxID=271503 RepID=UPI0035CB73F7
MENKLIAAVHGLPELYDKSSHLYRDRSKKVVAWRKLSEEVGLPYEICRRRWKGLRDTYLKKRREETGRRSGSETGSAKKWKYSAVLSFLDPFVTPRESSGSMGRRVEGDSTAEYFTDAGRDQDEMSEAAAGPSDIERGDEPDQSTEDGEEEPQSADPAPPPPPPPPAAPAAPKPPMGKRKAQNRSMRSDREREREMEERFLEALERSAPPTPPAPPPSEDELFLKSLVPSLERLPPQQKEYVKFQIHKLIYEASTVVLNLEHLE